MKDKGILFKPDMIKATQEDRKTMTRRLEGLKEINKNPDDWKFTGFADPFCAFFENEKENIITYIKCPYQIGQKLYVKETWGEVNLAGPDEYFKRNKILYKAKKNIYKPIKWKSPLFMPKKYARLWLEVIDIKIERLQDISEDDAIKEGVGFGFQMNAGYPDYQHIENGICTLTQDTAEISFATLWDSIHKKNPEYLWNKNPWVWVIEFKRIQQ